MDGTWVLILLALVMLVGSYVAGSIPLNVTMSEVSHMVEPKVLCGIKLRIMLTICELRFGLLKSYPVVNYS